MKISKLVWDEWNIDHISRHNVEPDEVEEVCEGKNLFKKWQNRTYRVIGQAENGRYITIFLAPRPGNSYYPITARNSTDKERKSFKKR